MPAPAFLLLRYRLSLSCFIVGLLLSGLTAFPLLTEIRWLAGVFDITEPARFSDYTGLRHWLALVWFGVEQTYARFPFIAYGTDWLAFGHLAIAVFFLRPLRFPLESDWVLRCGLICCVSVIPLAFIAGSVRGIPVFWRLIDCSFGVLGALPLLYCLRLSAQMRPAAAPAG